MALMRGRLTEFGELLTQNWYNQKKLHPSVTTSRLSISLKSQQHTVRSEEKSVVPVVAGVSFFIANRPANIACVRNLKMPVRALLTLTSISTDSKCGESQTIKL